MKTLQTAFKWGAIGLIMGLFVLGCATKPMSPPKTMPQHPSIRKSTLSDFNRVVIKGQIDINLFSGNKHPEVVLHGDPNDVAQVNFNVVNHTLFLTVNPGYPKNGALSADVHMRYLNAFTYDGNGQVNGRNIKTHLLDLTIKNSERTKLTGQIFLRKLDVTGPGYTEIQGVTTRNLDLQLRNNPKVMLIGMNNLSNLHLKGDGWFGMYWVKSESLNIQAKGHATIQLAGITNRLEVELWDYAHFNGRYLRAQRVFAKTHGHSIAGISSVDKQHTLATDQSDIYFYNIPNFKTDFMAFNGAVLDMRDWDITEQRGYDEFNK